MPCAICKRGVRGYGFQPTIRAPIAKCCSARCLDIYAHKQKAYRMLDTETINSQELSAIRAGGERAGAYLEALNKTDLAQLTKVEWDAFLAQVIFGYTEKLIEIEGLDVPF